RRTHRAGHRCRAASRRSDAGCTHLRDALFLRSGSGRPAGSRSQAGRLRDSGARAPGRRRYLARCGDHGAGERGGVRDAGYGLDRSMPARLRAGWLVPLALLAALVVTGVGRRHPGNEPLHSAERLPADDVMVRAVRFGSGDTTMVLLHGYGESLMSWRALSEQLAQRFRIVAVDLPGFGLSDKP